jgi:hypothetical protein
MRTLSTMNQNETRELLHANLRALHAVMHEHSRALDATVRVVNQLRRDLQALGGQNAPWIHALQETRALLYVALREIIVGPDHQAAQTQVTMPPQFAHG